MIGHGCSRSRRGGRFSRVARKAEANVDRFEGGHGSDVRTLREGDRYRASPGLAMFSCRKRLKSMSVCISSCQCRPERVGNTEFGEVASRLVCCQPGGKRRVKWVSQMCIESPELDMG